MRRHILLVLFVLALAPAAARADVSLSQKSEALAVVCAPQRVLAPATIQFPPDEAPRPKDEEEYQRQQLHEAVKDLTHYLSKISGAKFETVAGERHELDKRLPIYIGELGEAKFGPVGKTAPHKQAFRYVVTHRGIGLYGESDLATSYAIYTFLDELGCRWFMPTELGESIPSQPEVLRVNEADTAMAPATIYRAIWHGGTDYKRRNRMGGMYLNHSHALDSYTTPKQLEEHPDWVAVIKGKPSPPVIKWSKPEVADAIAETIIGSFDKGVYRYSASLSPEDGLNFDESEDPKIDAGGLDPILGVPRMTDRLLVLANRVAEKVTAKYPHALFGMGAYVNYTYPPVREPVHPSIVPVISPITFSRNHPVTDTGEPNNEELRKLIVGWGKKAKMTGTYFYGWNLAEVTAPNPMITKWSIDVPFVIEHGCRFFMPETDTNFETTLHALYLGNRLAWDPKANPAAIVNDLHVRFYGEAADEAAVYWRYVDELWVSTPEYAGAGLGHPRRFTPERVKEMRRLLDLALVKAKTGTVKARLAMTDASLGQFEEYMAMRRDFADGKFAGLDARAKAWVARQHELADKYRPQYAFTCRMYGKQPLKGANNGVDDFATWYQPSYSDADRVAREFAVLTTPPLRSWRYAQDKEKRGEALGYAKTQLDDAAWKATDVAVDSWSSLGFHNYYGRVWYRATVEVPPAAGKKTYLWLAGIDGRAKVFVNGVHVPYTNAKGETLDAYAGFAKPASFDITAALSSAAAAQIAIECERTDANEIGSGGLIGPALIYREK